MIFVLILHFLNLYAKLLTDSTQTAAVRESGSAGLGVLSSPLWSCPCALTVTWMDHLQEGECSLCSVSGPFLSSLLRADTCPPPAVLDTPTHFTAHLPNGSNFNLLPTRGISRMLSKWPSRANLQITFPVPRASHSWAVLSLPFTDMCWTKPNGKNGMWLQTSLILIWQYFSMLWFKREKDRSL